MVFPKLPWHLCKSALRRMAHLHSMEIISAYPLDPRPTRINRLQNLLRQWALFQINQILLQLLRTARPNNNRIPKLLLQNE